MKIFLFYGGKLNIIWAQAARSLVSSVQLRKRLKLSNSVFLLGHEAPICDRKQNVIVMVVKAKSHKVIRITETSKYITQSVSKMFRYHWQSSLSNFPLLCLADPQQRGAHGEKPGLGISGYNFKQRDPDCVAVLMCKYSLTFSQ